MNNKQSLPLGQKGIAQVLILVLLVGAIVLGTNLIQSRTNILPRAQEASCEEKDLVSCSVDQSDNGYTVTDEGYMQGDTCYRKIYQYSETLESGSICCTTPLTEAADQAECKANAIDAPPGEITTTPYQCPDNGLEYCEDNKTIRKFDGVRNESGECQYEFKDLGLTDECAGKGDGDIVKQPETPTTEPGGEQAICTEADAVISNLDTKALTNLAFYKAILKGTPEICVKADLGMEPHLYAHSENDSVNERRLFMCSGSEGQIKWRVVSEDGETLVPTLEDFSKDPDNLPNQEQAEKAQELAGI